MIEIINAHGRCTQVVVSHFPPLDGWDIQGRFRDFAASKDAAFKRAYTMEILSYATLQFDDGRTLPLSTGALIDNHLESWQNVMLVFEAVLKHNGIDPSTHADKPTYWEEAGALMAISFIAEATKLFGPAIEMAGNIHVKP